MNTKYAESTNKNSWDSSTMSTRNMTEYLTVLPRKFTDYLLIIIFFFQITKSLFQVCYLTFRATALLRQTEIVSHNDEIR